MWFVWNGIDSRQFGLYVSKLPPILRAEERVSVVSIPGRSGHLTMTEGEAVHNSKKLNCIITATTDRDIQPILSWLSGEGQVIFANDPNYVYFARIISSIEFRRTCNSLQQATVIFYCQPYKAQYPTESPVSLTGTSLSVINPGDVPSKPKVTVNYSGNINVSINDDEMTFTGISSKIIVDCETNIITNNDGTLWTGTYYGNFWNLEKGANTITANHSVTLDIEPRWRWL